MKLIKFQGNEYLLTDTDKELTGAIVTKEHYEAGIIGYAHLCEDGIISRYGEQIGTIEDIEVLREVDREKELNITLETLLNLLKNAKSLLIGGEPKCL